MSQLTRRGAIVADQDSPRFGVTFRASGSITDPDLFLQPSFMGDEIPAFVADTRIDLLDGRVTLVFSGARLVALRNREAIRFYPLLNYLIYRSRSDYNIVANERLPDPDALSPSLSVTFGLYRRERVTLDELIARYGKVLLHTLCGSNEAFGTRDVPESITIHAQELDDFVKVSGSYPLYLALTYFLIGCEHVRYFFVEFYKAIETIENALGGERRMIDALAPYGLVGSDLTRFKRKANDARRPYDLGRHAPDAGADLRTLDLRRVVGDSASARDSESEGVFRASWIVVRQAIDAYFAYLQVSVG
jgi:hypothetical protein